MTLQTEALKLKGEAIFKLQTELEKLFFSFPLSLDLLKSMGMGLLLGFLDEIKNKILSEFDESTVTFDLDNMNQIKNALKQNPTTNAILKAADSLMDEEALSNVLLECEKSKATNDISSIFDEGTTKFLTNSTEDLNQFIENMKVENSNSLLDKIDNIKDRLNGYLGDFNELMDILSGYFAYLLMAYYIIKLVISLFTTRVPSGYLSRYIGKLINTLIASVTDAAEEIYNMFKDILSIVISVDAILTGLIVATTLYLLNRKKYQNSSLSELSKSVCPEYLLANPIDAFDNNNDGDILDTNDIPDLMSGICDLPSDELEYIVPTETFEDKLANIELNCPIDFIEEDDITDLQESKEMLATHAVIENKREDNFNVKVKKGNNVTAGTIIGTVGEDVIYAPINGRVYKVTDNEVYFEEINDNNQSLIEEQSKVLSENYNSLNDSKTFLSKWVIPTLYPIMLANSPSNDGKLSANEALNTEYEGVDDKWVKIKEDYAVNVEEFELKVQEISSESNVTTHAENETLHLIKEGIDNEQNILYLKIKQYHEESINIAKTTSSKEGEYALIEYYFDLLLKLSENETRSSIEAEFYTMINGFQQRRLYIEQYDEALLKTRISELSLQLLAYAINVDDLIKSGETDLANPKDWLNDKSKTLAHITDIDKQTKINQILFLIEFVLQIPESNTKFGNLNETNLYDQIIKESNSINKFIASIWRKLDTLPKKIKESELLLDDLSILTIFSIIDIYGLNHRTYTITEGEVKCTDPDLDPNLGGKTVTDFGDLKYWLKYFSLATLVGCGMPGVGWATGFIGPTGPILLPVVYIPIKAIKMEYGFIVFGLTMTGVVPMPFMLFVNYSTLFQLPLFDPVVVLKNEIGALKLNLVGQLDEFKVTTIKQFLDQAKVELDSAASAYEGAKTNHIQHKSKKPPKTKEFREERVEWTITNAEYLQSKVTFGAAKFSAATKYSLLHILYVVGGGLSEKLSSGLGTAFSALKQAEDLINGQFIALETLIESLEKLIGPLPITLQPDSANWGFTLKMPVPLVPFGLQLSAPMIQLDILNPVIENFRANNEGFMTPAGITINYAEYLDLIQSMLSILIPRDPFPVYEKLKITNLSLLIFLTGELVPSGARSFGMPGMP